MTTKVDPQRQLADCLYDLKADKHHNLDISTLRKIDELIDLLETAQTSSAKSNEIYFQTLNIVAKIIERLPNYIELLTKLSGN